MGQRIEAVYEIVENIHGKPLVIRDLGHSMSCPSVTNDVENVVNRLRIDGHLPNGRRLLYYDSGGVLSEIVMKNGAFDGFIFCAAPEASS